MTDSSTNRPIIEILACIEAPSFLAGIVLRNDTVVEADENVQHMKGWTRKRVIGHCWRNGWKFATLTESKIGG